MRRTWDAKIGDPWCSQLICGRGLTIPTSDDTTIPPFQAANYESALLHEDQLDAQIAQLVAAGKVEEVFGDAIANLVINPLGMADKKDNGVVQPEKRICVDASRHVNFRLPHYDMKLPGYDDALRRLYPGCWMAKVDLSGAYLHVRIDQDSRRLLGFKWRNRFYRYSHMPFGLSTAPAVWQYLADRVCAYLRSLGLNVIVYLDDFLLIADSQSECQRGLDLLRDELTSLGLRVNHKKTISPTQCCRFLGLDLDSLGMQIIVPDYKLANTRALLASFRADFDGAASAPARALHSLIGKLSHVSRAVRSSRTFLRRMWDLIKTLPSGPGRWSRPVPLSRGFWLDFEWWERFLTTFNGRARWLRGPDHVCFSDASLSGFGFHDREHFRFGFWPARLRHHHINYLELHTIELACLHFGPQWAGKRILFACDNADAVAIILSGVSNVPALMELRRRIALIAALYDFDIRAVHIPGAHNVWADLLSRLVCDPESDSVAADLVDPSFLSSTPLSSISDPIFREFFSAKSHLGLFRSVEPERHLGAKTRAGYAEFVRDLAANLSALDGYARSLGGADTCGYERPLSPPLSGAPGIDGAPRPAARSEHSDAGGRGGARPLPDRVVEDFARLRGLQQGPPTRGPLPAAEEAPIPLRVVETPNPAGRRHWARLKRRMRPHHPPVGGLPRRPSAQ